MIVAIIRLALPRTKNLVMERQGWICVHTLMKQVIPAKKDKMNKQLFPWFDRSVLRSCYKYKVFDLVYGIMLSMWIRKCCYQPSRIGDWITLELFGSCFQTISVKEHNFPYVSLLECVVVIPFEFTCDSHWSISAFLLNSGTFRYVHIVNRIDKKVDFSRNYTPFFWGEKYTIVLWTRERNVDTDQKIWLVGNKE